MGTEPNTSYQDAGWRKALRIAAYPLGAVAGFIAGRVSTRGNVYNNLSQAGAFKDIEPEYHQRLAGIFTETPAGAGHVNGPQLAEQTHKEYLVKLRERFQERGFKNTLDYWKGLRPSQKIGAIGIAAGAAGVVITTLLSVSNNKHLTQRVNQATNTSESPDNTTIAR